MKKLFALIGTAALLFALAACGTPEEEQPEEQINYEIAMVTDAGIIMDGGYSEAAWNAITEFGADKGISHKYYKAAEATDESYRAVIDDAVAKGAGVIIADGDSFEDVVYNAQNEYPDVKFVLVDAEPMDSETGEIKITDNTAAVLFASEQAGYLAGYAVVKDGLTELGFLGGSRTPVVMDYGYGFLQGAEMAAEEIGVTVNVKYHYCSAEDERQQVVERASGWYKNGTQAIMVCGDNVEMPVFEAAELTSGKIIGCETDKSRMSDTVITSAAKDIGKALADVLDQYRSDQFPGGEIVQYNAENEGIWLELENGRLENLDKGEFETVYDYLADGTILVKRYNSGDIVSLKLLNVVVAEE